MAGVSAAHQAAVRALYAPPLSDLLAQLREGAAALARIVAEIDITHDVALVDSLDAQLEGMRRHAQRTRAALPSKGGPDGR